MIMLVDDFGRPVKSMRIQVNTTCNFSCFFCHMEGTPVNSSEMKAEEIERVVEIARDLGINKIKFTGGEPLMRNDIIDIVARTRKHIYGDISMTTNGVLLRKKASDLRSAGLNRINISMHSIDREGFKFITGVDALDKVRDGITAAKEAGFCLFRTLQVNMGDGQFCYSRALVCLFQHTIGKLNFCRRKDESGLNIHYFSQYIPISAGRRL